MSDIDQLANELLNGPELPRAQDRKRTITLTGEVLTIVENRRQGRTLRETVEKMLSYADSKLMEVEQKSRDADVNQGS